VNAYRFASHFTMAPRFLIAPDKFKGSLTARQAAEAIAAGVLRSIPSAELDLCPIADGGEGFMETLAPVLGASWVSCDSMDALARPIVARYIVAETPEGPTAIMEMAEASGMWRIDPAERQPRRSTTYGTGMQMAHAIRQSGVTRIILGLGGSATNDGGAGMAAALGIRFVTATGEHPLPVPDLFPDIVEIDTSSRIALPEILAACDVDNPLLGGRGATAIFSPQKGADREDRLALESSLERLVALCHGQKAANTPGAGAAGGLGFGLMQFAGATLESGFDIFSKLLDMDSRIRRATHVITGEGGLDHQSLSGKGPVGLARAAKSLGIPVTGFCGITDEEARSSGLFHSIHALADSGLPIEILTARAAELLTEAVAAADFSRHKA
jgi:glycerate 2-kinase